MARRIHIGSRSRTWPGNATPGNTRAGFTVLEMLVAVTILAMVCALVYETLTSVANTSDAARQAAAELRFRQYIYDSFNDNMNSIYTDPPCLQQSYALVGTDDSGPNGPADTLTFCTALPMPGATALPGVLREVTYEVVPESDDGVGKIDVKTVDSAIKATGRMMLQITETPLVAKSGDDDGSTDLVSEEKDTAQSQVHQIPVASFDVHYYDGYEQQWEDEWDSVDLKHMPWAIEISINLSRTQDEVQALYGQGVDLNQTPDLLMTFPIPVGVGALSTFPDMNHLPKSAGEDASGDSIFNDKGGKSGKSTKTKSSSS